MRKNYLKNFASLLLVLFASNAAIAQGGKVSEVNQTSKIQPNAEIPIIKPEFTVKGLDILPVEEQKKTRGPIFWSEDFAGGTTSTLPAGWSTSAPNSWKWRDVACTGNLNIGTINSATAGNGWLVFDSDSIGSLPGAPAAFNGWVQSPSINCSGRSSVRLTFSQHFRNYDDSCIVLASNDGGTTWTTYQLEQNSLARNTNLPTNPRDAYVNLSAVAANQANVIIRFQQFNVTPGGTFNWLIDDANLSEIDPIDLWLTDHYFLNNFGPDRYNYAAAPIGTVDSARGVVGITNFGTSNVASLTMSATYMRAGATISTSTDTYTNLPVNAMDSLAGFPDGIDLVANGTGDYMIAYNLTAAGDVNGSNNRDTTFFVVTDSVYSRNQGLIASTFVIHDPADANGPARSFGIGSRFTVARPDELTACRVFFSRNTQPGAKARASLYRFDASIPLWVQAIEGEAKTLTAADIPPATGPITSTTFQFPYDASSLQENELQPGITYAIVIENDGTPANLSAFIFATDNPNITSGGIGDTCGAGPGSFGDNGLPFGIANNPMVQAVFGNGRNFTVGTDDVAAKNIDINAYPVPAENVLNVTFSAKASTMKDVSVSVISIDGKVLQTKTLNTVNVGTPANFEFDLSGMPSGIYTYRLSQGNKVLATNKFNIAK